MKRVSLTRPSLPILPRLLTARNLSYIITVPAGQHPTKLQCPTFELIFGDFAPALLEVSFGMILHNSSGTNHREKIEKQFYAGTFFNTNYNDTLSLL